MGKGNSSNYKEETGRKKEKHGCNKICYGNNVKKYELIKRKEGVTAQVILKVKLVVLIQPEHTASAAAFRKSPHLEQNSGLRHTSQ